MTDRTIKFLGYGFGNTQSTITATVAGNVVYTGNVQMTPTLPSLGIMNPSSPSMFSITVDTATFGDIPVSITVDANTSPVVLGLATANFSRDGLRSDLTLDQKIALFNDPKNDALNASIQEEVANPPLSSAESTLWNDDTAPYSEKRPIQESHSMFLEVSSGASVYTVATDRYLGNVTIDGVSVPSKPAYIVKPGSTISYDFYLTQSITS
jgi:hypothetical protein